MEIKMKRKKSTKTSLKQTWIGLLIVMLAFLLVKDSAYTKATYVTGNANIALHFRQIGAIAGGILGFFVGLWFVLYKTDQAETLKNKLISFFERFFVVAVATFFIVNFGADFVNRTFDNNEPTVYETKITDKYFKSVHKAPDTHLFGVEIEGKVVYIDVTSYTYDQFRENDPINVYHCQGALGHEYYTVYKK